jgi:hypothetical protein
MQSTPNPIPTIYSVSPTSDTAGGLVTIIGVNLLPLLGPEYVSIGGFPANVVTTNGNASTIDTILVGVSPDGASGVIIVFTSNGSANGPGFTFLSSPPRFILDSYSGSFGNNRTTLTWNVQNEGIVSGYLLEKGTDSTTYLTIYSPTPGQGNYSYQDTALIQGNNYYLLRVVDTLGDDLVDTVVKVVVPTIVRVNSNPNPAKGTVHVQVPNSTVTSTLQLISTSGTLLKTVSVPAGTFQVTLDVMDVPSGIYILLWQNGSTRSQKNVMIAN